MRILLATFLTFGALLAGAGLATADYDCHDFTDEPVHVDYCILQDGHLSGPGWTGTYSIPLSLSQGKTFAVGDIGLGTASSLGVYQLENRFADGYTAFSTRASHSASHSVRVGTMEVRHTTVVEAGQYGSGQSTPGAFDEHIVNYAVIYQRVDAPFVQSVAGQADFKQISEDDNTCQDDLSAQGNAANLIVPVTRLYDNTCLVAIDRLPALPDVDGPGV